MIRRGSSRFGCVVPGCSWWWFLEPSLVDSLGVFSGSCSWGFDGGNLWEPFVVLWAVIPLPNPWVNGLYFGVFRVLGLEVLLAGFLRFLLFGQVLVGLNLAMDSSWGVPIIPKVLSKPVKRFGRSRFGFGGVDPQVLFISSCRGYTGLTSACDRSDRCNPWWVFCSGEVVVLCWSCFEFGSVWRSVGLFGDLGAFRSDRCNPWWVFCSGEVVVLCWSCFEFGSVWRSVGLFGDLGAFRLRPVWPVCLTGLTGVEPLCGSRQVSPAGIGLTGGAHRSDRCWLVDSRFGVPLRSRVCEVGSWFLGSVAL
jgi:hypothetical protein